MKGEYFSVFSAIFLSQTRYVHEPISMRMRVHFLLSNVFGSGEGESGTPIAYIRYGVVPWPLEISSWVS